LDFVPSRVELFVSAFKIIFTLPILYVSGLNEVHLITQGGGCRLRVEIGDWSGDAAWAHYRSLVSLGMHSYFL